MPAAWLTLDQRFTRVGEGGDGAVGQGSFGEVFQGFDELMQRHVFIKRQKCETNQAAKEMACYNLLSSFPHPNIVRVWGMWTAQLRRRTYLYIAMESCFTSLWQFIRVGHPRSHQEYQRYGGPQQLLLGIVRALDHLHFLGTTHGDASLSNILLSADGVVKLADFGTVSAHTYLTADPLCADYIRPPEAMLGSLEKGPPVDAWAVAIAALALWTGHVPTSPHALPSTAAKDDYVITAAAVLLPRVTNMLWPDHSNLPRWHKYQDLFIHCPETGTLAQFVADRLLNPSEFDTSVTVALVQLGLQWNPLVRSTMLEMEKFLLEKFLFPGPQGCQPDQCHLQPGSSLTNVEPKTIPAAALPMSVNPVKSEVKSDIKFPCRCSGNCGLQPCTSRLNARRTRGCAQICENFADVDGGFCHSCQCERESCIKQRQKDSKRWCKSCERKYKKSDFVTAQGSRSFEVADSPAWKVVCRLNFLHKLLEPDDNVAWQEICRLFNAPEVGNPMDPIGVVILVLAHALKWPPVVRHFRDILKGRMSPSSLGLATAAILVDAFYEAIVWADGKCLVAMHDILSVAGRAHSCSGAAVTAQQLGLITNARPKQGQYKLISLGKVGKAYYLRPRAEVTVSERVVNEFIVLATHSAVHWPAKGTSLNTFAREVSLLIAACHSVSIDGFGLTGGKCVEKEMKSRTPRTGCQPATRISNKAPPYVVPHITRHFILAADELGVFDYESMQYKDIEEHMPDVTMQAVPRVGNHTLAEIKNGFGLDPFHLSCHLCFLHQIPDDDLLSVLNIPYKFLYEPIGKNIITLSAPDPELDSHPLNLHALLKALVLKAKSLSISDGDAGIGRESSRPTACKRRRKVKNTIE